VQINEPIEVNKFEHKKKEVIYVDLSSSDEAGPSISKKKQQKNK
jgi:hypothetical protein